MELRRASTRVRPPRNFAISPAKWFLPDHDDIARLAFFRGVQAVARNVRSLRGDGRMHVTIHTRPAGIVAPPVSLPVVPQTRIRDSAVRRLRESHYHGLRSVECEYHEGILTLRGEVVSFFLKQMAQVLVARTEGVEQIVNHLRVPSRDDFDRAAGV